MVLQDDPEELWLLEALQARKNHGNTATQSQSTDKVAPHWDPKDLVQQEPVEDLADQAMDGMQAMVLVRGSHSPQAQETQVYLVVGANLHQVQDAELNQVQWASL